MGSKGRHRTHCIKCNNERILLKIFKVAIGIKKIDSTIPEIYFVIFIAPRFSSKSKILTTLALNITNNELNIPVNSFTNIEVFDSKLSKN